MERYSLGKLEPEEWTRFSEAIEQMRNIPIFFDEQPAMTLPEIAAKARMLKRKNGIKLLVLDYIQLCGTTNPKLSRHHQLEELSRGLKALAKQLDISILTLSQLNREVEKRTSGRPQLSDLKESGAIEEDADVVMLMWCQEKKDGYQLNGLDMAKVRGGRTGQVALHFEGQYQRWHESTESLNQAKKGSYGGEL
jgi:replicative DNA helicase